MTVEETNVESMDTADEDDTETITLTRSKVYYIFCSFLKVCVGCLETDQCEQCSLYVSWRYTSNGKGS